MLDKELRLKRILLSDENEGFNSPYRICVDNENGQLFDGQMKGGVTVYKIRIKGGLRYDVAFKTYYFIFYIDVRSNYLIYIDVRSN